MSAVRSNVPVGYTIRDVARLLDISAYQIRTFVRAGFLKPAIGPKGEYRFTFQDMVLMRTAKGLSDQVPPARVRRALRKLRDQLPRGRELTGVRITAAGDDIVVSDGSDTWNPESGQTLLNFEVARLAAKVAPLARKTARAARRAEDLFTADDWYELGCDLEAVETEQARDSYRRALELDPVHVDARINLGRLLHESGAFRAAEMHYRMALAARPGYATAAFNLGVVYEDLRQQDDALQAYELAIRLDGDYADAYYNAAHLCERLGKPRRALRYLQSYRRLTEH